MNKRIPSHRHQLHHQNNRNQMIQLHQISFNYHQILRHYVFVIHILKLINLIIMFTKPSHRKIFLIHFVLFNHIFIILLEILMIHLIQQLSCLYVVIIIIHNVQMELLDNYHLRSILVRRVLYKQIQLLLMLSDKHTLFFYFFLSHPCPLINKCPKIVLRHFFLF